MSTADFWDTKINGLFRTDIVSGQNSNDMAFLYNFVKTHQFTNVLEIGMADGMSSIPILLAISENTSKSTFKLTSIDPYQKTQWNSNGIKNIETLGFSSNHELIENTDILALPKLLEKGEKYDFIFIDGYHTFDHVLLNNFYADQLLKIGGFIINDDILMPSIQCVCSYLTKNYKHFEVDKQTYHRFGPIYKKIANKNIKWNEFTRF
jgi:predicted O-methyltransferase YrrM